MEKLIKLLRNHDWYYQYSDDPGVWQRGTKQRAEINAEAKRLGRPELVEQAFEEYKTGDLDWWLAELEEIHG